MELKKLPDQELISQFLSGNQQAIEVLISRHKDKVYTYIFLLVKDPVIAEDIFQDTFVKIVNSLVSGRYKDDGKFVSWTIRIAHNLTIDHFRKIKKSNEIQGNSFESFVLNSKKYSVENVEEEIIREQIKNDIRNLVDELPAEQKEVILLRHYGGLSFKEIAEQTGVSINTSLGRMRYALINLRKMIGEKNLSLTLS